MGHKRKSKSRDRPECRPLRDEQLGGLLAELLDAGKIQKALEIVKEICYRDLLGEHQQFAERAYVLRAAELARKGLHKEAGVIVDNALGCGVVGRSLAEVALCCGLATGEVEAATRRIRRASADSEAAADLLADLAVLAQSSSAQDSSAQSECAVGLCVAAGYATGTYITIDHNQRH